MKIRYYLFEMNLMFIEYFFSWQMETTIELILKLGGSLVLIFTMVWVLNRLTGYGKFYDKMMSSDDSDKKIKNTNWIMDSDIMQHVTK